MALDIAILNEEKKYQFFVEVGDNDHFRIMKVVEKENLGLLKRMSNYYNYEVVVYKLKDLSHLKKEVEKLLEIFQTDNVEIRKFLIDLKKLINKAVELKKELQVISD